MKKQFKPRFRTEGAIFISWIGFHGRSQGWADTLNVDSAFVDGGAGVLPLRYLRQWRATWRILENAKPTTVLLMLPPLPSLICVWLWSRGKRVRIVGDLHTGVFSDPKWKWATALTLALLRGRNAAVVTNERLAMECRLRGVHTLIAHDPITMTLTDAETEQPTSATQLLAIDENYVLLPLAYAHDEPLDEILEAARLVSSVRWVMTGKPPESIIESAPPNVIFSGFVSNADFAYLVRNTAAILALTTEENTMQRAGYEAMIAEKALVTSSTEVLKEYFGAAAVYADSTAQSIADAVTSVLRDRIPMEEKMRTQRVTQLAAQELAASQLANFVGEREPQDAPGNTK